MSLLSFKAHTARRLYAEFVVSEDLATAINGQFGGALVQQPRGMLLAKSRLPRYALSIHFPDRFVAGTLFAVSYLPHLCPDHNVEHRISLFPAPEEPDNTSFDEVSFPEFVAHLRDEVFKVSESCTDWQTFFYKLIESQAEYLAPKVEEGGASE
jgi:hypothetical protein